MVATVLVLGAVNSFVASRNYL
uniref:Uncharacterized protein n=1 Tax=Arundo donax TaxID=35708 RepID=A0A0A9B2V8_ARUDO